MKDVSELIEDLLNIRKAILEGEEEYQETIDLVHPHYKYSATNFIRYLKLRTFDLRKTQVQLSVLGLSSISHSERHVLANVENILYFLFLSKGETFKGRYAPGKHPVNFLESQKVLKKNTRRLLKVKKSPRNTSIMVTLSTKGTEYQHVKDLVLTGMEIARINCSHDDREVWERMVENVKLAVQETGKPCSIYFDLAGPKLRTGKIMRNKPKAHILLRVGDILHLYREEHPDKATGIQQASGITPAISCSIPEIFEDVSAGDPIWFDDGKIGGLVDEVKDEYLVIKITKTNPKGGKLREEKGINLPGTNLNLPSLTAEDINNLPFVVQHADMVGFFFRAKAF